VDVLKGAYWLLANCRLVVLLIIIFQDTIFYFLNLSLFHDVIRFPISEL